MQSRYFTIVAVLLCTFAQAAHAGGGEGTRVGDIEVVSAWARATPGHAPMGAGFVSLKNNGAEGDRIVEVRSTVAKWTEVHETIEIDGVMRMREVEDRRIAPGGTFDMHPGGYHVMFMRLNQPLRHGETVRLEVQMEKAGTIPLDLPILPIGSMGPGAEAN